MLTRCTFVLLMAAFAFAQSKDEAVGARAMFYEARVKSDNLPPVTAAARTEAPPAQRQTAQTPVVAAVHKSGALHLGIRYNLVLVDKVTGRRQAVASDRVFARGECFAIDFESNRAGYLYVLAQQSSGNWMPLFPSPEMAEESNIVRPGSTIRVPADYCFELRDPPGAEKLFVILSRDPNEVYDLHELIHQKPPAASTPRKAAPEPKNDTYLVADARMVNQAVARMRDQFDTRDIAITKVDQPAATQEPEHSVYVVAAAATPSSSVVTQIEVRHR